MVFMAKRAKKPIVLAKAIVFCDSCGNGLRKGDRYWSSTGGIMMCEDCIWYPLFVLKLAYNAKTLKKAKEIIKEFDDECDASFLVEE